MRSAGAAFLAVVTAGLAGLVIAAASDQRRLAFTLGVRPTTVAAEVAPGEEACQSPVDVAERFAAVQLKVGTFSSPGPELALSIRPAGGGAPLARGRLAAGYPDGAQPIVRVVGDVPAERRVAVCVRNLGRRRATLYGGDELAARDSRVALDDRPLRADLTLVFLRDESRSTLSLLPAMFSRASLFHPGWVGAWTFWLLLALVGLGAPLLLLAAQRAAAGDEG